MKFLLHASGNELATKSGTPLVLGSAGMRSLKSTRTLIFTLDVTAADSGGTYDIYATTGDDTSNWDVVHFSQIAGTSAKRYTARVKIDADPMGTVTTATPGVAAIDPATLATVTAGSAQGIKTLGAGLVRHGAIGNTFSHELVAAGTVTTGITYSLTMTAE